MLNAVFSPEIHRQCECEMRNANVDTGGQFVHRQAADTRPVSARYHVSYLRRKGTRTPPNIFGTRFGSRIEVRGSRYETKPDRNQTLCIYTMPSRIAYTEYRVPSTVYRIPIDYVLFVCYYSYRYEEKTERKYNFHFTWFHVEFLLGFIYKKIFCQQAFYMFLENI